MLWQSFPRYLSLKIVWVINISFFFSDNISRSFHFQFRCWASNAEVANDHFAEVLTLGCFIFKTLCSKHDLINLTVMKNFMHSKTAHQPISFQCSLLIPLKTWENFWFSENNFCFLKFSRVVRRKLWEEMV